MRRLPTVPFYMITAICKAKFFTANQFAKTNLRNYLNYMVRELSFKIIYRIEVRFACLFKHIVVS